ncbi:hypothetical protein ABT324_08830 [Saccharopolyspora sp. NPDC000359]|uniref:hypothetical protein n=1 Tax=Saccharopolyspora sp. NPDC000359 TaxID=3154251 RepID=UPI003330DDC1
MNSNVWHLTRKKSWWNGTVTTWCGLQAPTSDTLSEYLYFGPAAPKCTACKAAKKNR